MIFFFIFLEATGCRLTETSALTNLIFQPACCTIRDYARLKGGRYK